MQCTSLSGKLYEVWVMPAVKLYLEPLQPPLMNMQSLCRENSWFAHDHAPLITKQEILQW